MHSLLLLLALAAPGEVTVVVYSQPGCAPCVKMKAELQKNLPKYGYQLGAEVTWVEDGTADLSLLKQQKVTVTPTTELRRDGKLVARWTGIVSAKTLATNLKELVRGDQGSPGRKP